MRKIKAWLRNYYNFDMTNYPKLCELKSANKNQSTVIINQENIFMHSIKWIIFNCQMFCEVLAKMAG